MAVAKADASSSVRPRSLDMIANQAASAEPVHDDITGSCIKSFEHRHLADDTGRQVGELRKLSRRRPDGFFLHELAPLAQLMTLVATRLERLGGESGDLGPAAAAMILLCTRPFQMKLASDEARFTADATPLFEALALFLSTPPLRRPPPGGPASKDPVRRMELSNPRLADPSQICCSKACALLWTGLHRRRRHARGDLSPPGCAAPRRGGSDPDADAALARRPRRVPRGGARDACHVPGKLPRAAAAAVRPAARHVPRQRGRVRAAP